MRVLPLLVGLPVVAACGCGAPSGPPVAPEPPARPLSLRPGTMAEAPLAGGESQAWSFSLRPGWFAELIIEQQGIDAMVRLDTAGRRLTEVDGTNGAHGPEPLLLLGETALQPLRLTVAAPAQAPAGRYLLQVAALRPATDRDRARVAAERTFERGEVLRRQGRGDALWQAVAEHRRAREAFRALGDRRREADALDRLGRIHLALGDAAAAREAYRQAILLFRELGARQATLAALNGLGSAARSLGRPAEALEHYREALGIHAALGDRLSAGITWNNIGRLLATQGDTEEAFRAYDRALAIWRELRERGEEGATLANVGRLYGFLGEAERARDALEGAAARLEAAGRLTDAAAALAHLGLVLATAGQPREGLATLQRALRLQQQAGNRSGEAAALNYIGWIHLRNSAPEAAQTFFQKALALYEELGRRPDQGTVLANLGELEARRGHPSAALELYERALPLVAEGGDRSWEASVLFERARAQRQLGDLERARQSAREALDRIEALRSKPGSGDLRASFLASRQEIHDLLIQILLELDSRQPAAGYRAEALAVSERAKARSLLDVVSGDGTDPAGALESILTVPRIQREVVASNTLLLEYSLGETQSVLWVVEHDRLDVFALPPRARLEEEARRAHALLAAEDRTLAGPRTEAALTEVSRLLLSPVADRLAGQRLLVVPDGALAYVPFAALPRPATGGAAPGEPLVEAHEIVMLPSASMLAALRRRGGRPAPPGLLAVVADPVFIDGGLPSLPFSRQEAENILRLAPPGQGLAALGFAASRETVTGGALARYRILHFATHGLIDPRHPASSGLALSQVDAQGKRRNGFLRAPEIWRLHLPADLVVLSACRTALGKEVRGEGLMGLTQSFFQAGAQRVLVSLWPVDDRATAELMTRFYRAMLAEGQSPAAALRTAQRSLRREPPFRSPAFWAGFVLQGDL